MTAAHCDLAEVGEGILEQLIALAESPSPGRAAAVAANLEGARLAVLRLREHLMEVRDAVAE